MTSKEENIETIRNLVKPEYAKIKCWAHGFSHIERVVETIKVLAEMEGENPYLFILAAYCHDLGRVRQEKKGDFPRSPDVPNNHGELSVKPTKKFLRKIGIKGKDKKDILDAVKKHPMRGYQGKNKILNFLQDADKGDGIGKWGIVRIAKFNSKIDLDEPNKENIDQAIEKARKELIENKTSREEFLKLSRISLDWSDKNMLHTESAKKYFIPDFQCLRNFIDSLKDKL